MKSIRLLLILLIAAFSAQAQIPNASFESWYAYSLGEYPTGWMTSDSVAVALGGSNNAIKGSDPYEGSFSLHLISVQTAFVKGPGVATNGKIVLDGATFKFSGGSPDTTRSRFLNGQYKYVPTNPNDAGMITILLLHDSAGVKDTVAMGSTMFTGNVPNYTAFNCELTYNTFNHNPDTCLIIIQSSRGINDPNLGVGTELVIDSLGFFGTVGIDEANDVINSVIIFPSPAHNQLNVHVDLKRKTEMNYSVYDLNGRKVLSQSMNSEKELIDISSLAKGNYILKLSDDNNNSLYSKNFIKD